jgi:hypothetical protein
VGRKLYAYIKEMLFKDPNDFLNELKRRTRRRNEALKIYNDLPYDKKEIILKKLELINRK